MDNNANTKNCDPLMAMVEQSTARRDVERGNTPAAELAKVTQERDALKAANDEANAKVETLTQEVAKVTQERDALAAKAKK